MIRHHPLVFAYVTLVLLACLGGLAGCAAGRPAVVTKEVKVPVAVSCAAADLPPPPTYAADATALDGTIFDLARALLIDREQRRQSELTLRAALEACR